jgi:hypothetical protein
MLLARAIWALLSMPAAWLDLQWSRWKLHRVVWRIFGAEAAMSLSVLQVFLGKRCEVCGRDKESRRSFCSRCYRTLPQGMQSALWKRFGSGYEDAYAAALAYLRRNRPAALFE